MGSKEQDWGIAVENCGRCLMEMEHGRLPDSGLYLTPRICLWHTGALMQFAHLDIQVAKGERLFGLGPYFC
jgi:hypothetical protein